MSVAGPNKEEITLEDTLRFLKPMNIYSFPEESTVDILKKADRLTFLAGRSIWGVSLMRSSATNSGHIKGFRNV